MEEQNIGQWLQERCMAEHLSFREAATKTGLSHATIRDAIYVGHPSPQTIIKLAQAFANGTKEQLALEDYLLVLAGHRTPRPDEGFNEPLAQLLDAVRGFNEPRLKLMKDVANFIVEIGAKDE